MPSWKKIIVSGSNLSQLNNDSGFATTGSNTFKGNQTISGSVYITGSFSLIGNSTHTGSVYHSGSQFQIGIFNQTGSLNISGSTTQIGNNALLGNTLLSGSIIISGSATTPTTPTIKVYGDMETNGVIKFVPVVKTIDNTISGSYIYVSGSTNDLYFSQNGSGYSNATRLRWLESTLYTGLLNGGNMTSTPGSTTFTVASGSGIIINQNASLANDPFPTITTVSWPQQTLPITYSGSAKISYIGIDNTGTIVQQPYAWGSQDITQWDTSIHLGVVLHLSGSVSTGVYNSPQISYGPSQRQDDFFRAFGPLKVSGHTLLASGSTLGITKAGGLAYKEGANYVINPNHPSAVTENAISTSKIYRYHLSGSTPVIDTGVANAGYTVIDPTQYVNTTTGQLTTVTGNNSNQWRWTIQRVFWIPNSPTNAFIVYYGNAEYTTLIDAKNGIDTETFTEAPNTALNAILIGYILVRKGCTDLSDTTGTNAVLIQGGLFRSIGGIGGSGTVTNTSLASLSDVTITSPTYGDLLMYDTTVWNNTKTLSGSYILSGSLRVNNGGSITGSLFGSASYALTASYAMNGGGGGTPGGSNTQIQFNSSNTFAGTASFTFNYQSQSLQQGFAVTASGLYSHAQGSSSKAQGDYSHAEGQGTFAVGPFSHAEGLGVEVYAAYSHGEGFGSLTFGNYSHAEGRGCVTAGENSHAEGYSTRTEEGATYAHAEGYLTIAYGTASHAGGYYTIASGSYQTVVGQYNKHNNTTDLFVIGNGTADANRSDVFNVSTTAITMSGSVNISGSLLVNGTAPGGSSVKAGQVTAGTFAGSPLTAAVSFNTNMTGDYSISIIGVDARSWTVQSIGSSGFTINSNSSVALTGNVYWTATPHSNP